MSAADASIPRRGLASGPSCTLAFHLSTLYHCALRLLSVVPLGRRRGLELEAAYCVALFKRRSGGAAVGGGLVCLNRQMHGLLVGLRAWILMCSFPPLVHSFMAYVARRLPPASFPPFRGWRPGRGWLVGCVLVVERRLTEPVRERVDAERGLKARRVNKVHSA